LELFKKLELFQVFEKSHQIDIFTDKKVPLKRWPALWRFFIDPAGLSVLWFTLKNVSKIFREKYDVVVPVDGGWQPAIVRIVTWLYGGKMVISGQSGMGWDDRNNLWCFPNCFVALSTYAKSWAKKVNPFINVEYIPNGVNTKEFNLQGEAFRGVILKKPIVLCVGALTPAKRIDLAIKAVAELNHLRGGRVKRSETSDSSDGGLVSLLVIGDGYLKEELQKLGEKMLGYRFQILKLPFSEMPKVYRLANAFTLPSESFQSFEIVLLEAMATNLPVVANSDPIRKEIVNDAGILVNPTNTEEYAKAIQKALAIKWGNKPRLQAKKFDWDKIAGKYEEIFDKLTK